MAVTRDELSTADGERAGGALRPVLLVTFYFDQDTEIGTLRPRALARDLPGFGWRPIVLTAGDPGDDITRADLVVRHIAADSAIQGTKRRLGIDVRSDRPAGPALVEGRGPRALLRLPGAVATELGGLVPNAVAWAWRARRVGRRMAREFGVEAVYSSSPSHVANLVAWSIAGRWHVPWIAELRDLWAQRPYRSGTRLRRLPDRVLETITFGRVAALVTVSEPLAAQLRRAHPRTRVEAIPPGIDAALVAPEDGPVEPDFRLLYAGRIYEGHQDLGLLLRALRRAIDAGSVTEASARLDLILLHPLPSATAALVRELGLDQIVHVETARPRSEVIERERRAQLLVHLRWDDPQERGIVTGKLFEYLAARRPILSTGRYRDDVGDLLRATGAGRAPEGEGETVAALAAFHAEYRAAGRVPFGGIPAALEQRDVRAAAAAVARLLDEVSAGARTRAAR